MGAADTTSLKAAPHSSAAYHLPPSGAPARSAAASKTSSTKVSSATAAVPSNPKASSKAASKKDEVKLGSLPSNTASLQPHHHGVMGVQGGGQTEPFSVNHLVSSHQKMEAAIASSSAGSSGKKTSHKRSGGHLGQPGGVPEGGAPLKKPNSKGYEKRSSKASASNLHLHHQSKRSYSAESLLSNDFGSQMHNFNYSLCQPQGAPPGHLQGQGSLGVGSRSGQ